MILAIEFEYKSFWTDCTDEEYAELRSVIPTLPAEKPTYTPFGTHLVDQDALDVLAKYGVSFHLSKDDKGTSVGTMLVKLQDRIDALELREKQNNTAELLNKGAAVQIAIPDLGLMHVKEVCHLDDCCTDYLQSYLNEGWRILAVCPPNAQRRPDYILGRNQ